MVSSHPYWPIQTDSPQIDFDEKLGNGTFPFRNTSDDIDDMPNTAYDEPVRAVFSVQSLSDGYAVWCDEGLHNSPAPESPANRSNIAVFADL